jgi:hypothetical protein
MAFDSIHRLAGVAPDLETVPPNRPFLLGAPAADHYAEALFHTRTGLHAFQFPAATSALGRHAAHRGSGAGAGTGAAPAPPGRSHSAPEPSRIPARLRPVGRQRPDGDVGLLRDDRPGWLQGHQRPARPSGRRRRAGSLRRYAAPTSAPRRHHRAAGRRRVRPDPDELQRRRCVPAAGTPAAGTRRITPVSARWRRALRFSAGVAELHAAESLGQVLERADAALLDAKRQGKAMVA